MIATELARSLRAAGLVWRPTSGDEFRLDGAEADDEVFTISELTIEAHHFPTGTVLGFNGTTEWALDSVDLADALWLPREDQLRSLLQSSFRSLRQVTDAPPAGAPDPGAPDPGAPDPSAPRPGAYRVDIEVAGSIETFAAADAADAYGRALLFVIERLTRDTDDLADDRSPADCRMPGPGVV